MKSTTEAVINKLISNYDGTRIIIRDNSPLPNFTEALVVDKHNIPVLLATSIGARSARVVTNCKDDALPLLLEKLEGGRVIYDRAI